MRRARRWASAVRLAAPGTSTTCSSSSSISPNGERMKLERILVPVDFSPASLQAWELAGTLARAADAQVEALHVYELPLVDNPTATFGSLPLTPELAGDLQRRLAERLGARTRITVAEGFASDQALRLTEERDI